MRLEEAPHRCLAPISRERPSDRRARSRNNCLLDGKAQTQANLQDSSTRQSEATYIPKLASRPRTGFIDERSAGRAVPKEQHNNIIGIFANNNKLPPLPKSTRSPGSTVCSPRRVVRHPLNSRLQTFKPEEDPAFQIHHMKPQCNMPPTSALRPRPPIIMPVERARMPSTAEELTRKEATRVEMHRSQPQTPRTPRRASRHVAAKKPSDDVRMDAPRDKSSLEDGQLERWVGLLVSAHILPSSDQRSGWWIPQDIWSNFSSLWLFCHDHARVFVVHGHAVHVHLKLLKHHVIPVYTK
jgi:hypothetical protein